MKRKRRTNFKNELATLPNKSGAKKRQCAGPTVAVMAAKDPSSNSDAISCDLFEIASTQQPDALATKQSFLATSNSCEIVARRKRNGRTGVLGKKPVCDPQPTASVSFPTEDTTKSGDIRDILECNDLTTQSSYQLLLNQLNMESPVASVRELHATNAQEPSALQPEDRPMETDVSYATQLSEPGTQSVKRENVKTCKKKLFESQPVFRVERSSASLVKEPRKPEVHLGLAEDYRRAPKLYRFIICEWFYSEIDASLFAEGSDGDREFATLLRTHFPALQIQTMKRVEWSYIRRKLSELVSVPVRRRCSAAFFLSERNRLELRREKVRFLEENKLFEYQDNDLPPFLPLPIVAGSKVKAQLNTPQYGLFEGIVVGIERAKHSYRVSFAADGFGEQIVPDYRLALVKDNQEHLPATVVVSKKFIKAIQTLEKSVANKCAVLDQMANLRINTEARRVSGKPIETIDRERAQQYVEAIKKIIVVNRTILLQGKAIYSMYHNWVGTAPPVEMFGAPEVYEPEVVDVAEELVTGFKECLERETTLFNPVEQLWNRAMQRMHGRPECLDELRRYIQSTIGADLRRLS